MVFPKRENIEVSPVILYDGVHSLTPAVRAFVYSPAFHAGVQALHFGFVLKVLMYICNFQHLVVKFTWKLF
jgi:hypothetical protein